MNLVDNPKSTNRKADYSHHGYIRQNKGIFQTSLPESTLLNDRQLNDRQSNERHSQSDKPSKASPALGATSTDLATTDQTDKLRRAAGFESNRAEALEKLLKKHSGTHQLVLLQDFPDPDALSSAWAYRLMAQAYNIQSDIYFSGTLSHQENIALVRLTNLPAKRWPSNAKEAPDLAQYQGYVLIDTQGTTSHLTEKVREAELPLLLVVDHHATQGKLSGELLDIRPNIHATATIMTEYLSSGIVQLDRSNDQHVKCATALMHGLRSDTGQLMQASEPDFLAAAFLSKYYDAQLLSAVLQASRSRRVMDVIERSLRNRQIQNSVSIAGVGYLRYEDRDAIPQAADFLVTEENVHTAVVYGIVHDEDEEKELVVGSLRTNKITLDPDEFIKEALGQDNHGRFFGGGRSMAGGFEIPIGFLSGYYENSDYNRQKWEVFDKQIKQKLQRLVNPENGVLNTD